MPENDVESEILTASYHGENCRHNGENPNYELACDECPYYLECFPDWQIFQIQLNSDAESKIKAVDKPAFV